MPTETTVLHSSEETNPILDRAKEKLKEELKEAEKALVDTNTKLGALGESASEEDKAKAIDELTKAKARVDELKEKLKAAEGTHEDGEVTPSPVVPGAGAVESPTTGGSETTPTKPKEDEGHKPAPSTGGEEGAHGTTETHEATGTPGSSETQPPAGDHLDETHTEVEPPAAHAEEGKHEETHEEKKPSADEAALKAKAEAAKAEVETAKKDLEKAQAKVEELAKDEHASEADKAAAAKALVEAKAKVEETTKEAAKAEAAANPANKLGGVAFALASGAYRML